MIKMSLLFVTLSALVTFFTEVYSKTDYSIIDETDILCEIVRCNKDRGRELIGPMVRESDNLRGKSGIALLHRAAARGCLEWVQLLLELGVNYKSKDEHCFTALDHAIYHDHTELIKWLLNQGAEINSINTYAMSILHSAVQKRDVEMVAMLLDRGVDVTIQDPWHGTPLHMAVFNTPDNTAMIKLLLERGADVKSTKWWDGFTPLHAALYWHDEPVAEDRSFNYDAIELLLKYGAEVNAQATEYNLETPLTLAVKNTNSPAIVELLIKKGADVNHRNGNNYTPLCIAARLGKKELVKLLVDNGAYMYEYLVTEHAYAALAGAGIAQELCVKSMSQE